MSGSRSQNKGAVAQPAAPVAKNAPGAAFRAAADSRRMMLAHMQRCRALGQPTEAEVAAMVAAFVARGAQITSCSPAHAMAIQNGAGRDAARWTT
jgi:hypothetical protein